MNRISMFITGFIFFSSASLFSQTILSDFEYYHPRDNSIYVSKGTTIIIRQGAILDDNVNLANIAQIKGSISGEHGYTALIVDDYKTIILKPQIEFYPGEVVQVELYPGIKTGHGDIIGGLSWQFTISPKTDYGLSEEVMQVIFDDLGYNDIYKNDTIQEVKDSTERDWSLPGDFPPITVSVLDNPDSGYVFIAARNVTSRYIMILDNTGYPVFFRKLDKYVFDFKKQHNDMLSYLPLGRAHYVMDSTYTIVDSVQCGNGYEDSTDPHDFQLLANGHYLVLAADQQYVDMSQYVECGQTNAVVVGLVFQELDTDKNVIFEWRSWDHFEITDVIDQIDLCAGVIDYVHCNSVELDLDSNYVISNRSLNEITRIDRATGEIIWRLNGKNNDFTFVNDTLGFSYQHDARILPNGNLTLFDNGCWYTPQFSRASEYEIDEYTMTATLVWAFRDDPDIFGFQNGNTQRLTNGNTMIGWGGPTTPTLTEVHADSTKAFELTFGESEQCWSYRAFRFPWHGMVETPLLILEQYDDYIHLIFHKFGDNDISKFYIYAGASPDEGEIIDSTEQNYMLISELPDQQYLNYYFWVTAVDSESNESLPSNAEQGYLQPGEDLAYLPGDVNMAVVGWPPETIGADVTFLVNYFRGLPTSVACYIYGYFASADVNGDCIVVGGDVTYLINYLRGLNSLQYCPDYPTIWPTIGDLPQEQPDNWPNCQ